MAQLVSGLTYTEIYRTDSETGNRHINVTGLLARVVIDPFDLGVSVSIDVGAADPTQGTIRARMIADTSMDAVSVLRADDATNGVTHFTAVFTGTVDDELAPATDA